MGSVRAVLIGLALALFPALAGAACAPDTVELRGPSGVARFHVELADDPAEQAKGLMFREKMAASAGMLFVFPKPKHASFWMKNTLIPLTAAFIADDGTIVNLVDMKPLDEASHCSQAPVRYVLEMNQGWFAQRHLRAGHKLHGTPFGKAR